MLELLIPGPIKRYLRGRTTFHIKSVLAGMNEQFMQSTHYFPLNGTDDLLMPKGSNEAPNNRASGPCPPSHLWVNYGRTGEEYLETGRKDVEIMLDIFREAGASRETGQRILEFGCAAGRMIRWLPNPTASEIWGTDVWSEAIAWCKQYLSPPIHFMTTTVSPHLPFEDRYFDIIYAGSVFTHIDDLAQAWLQELRRILKPGGYLYVTISDRNVAAFAKGDKAIQESSKLRFGGKWDSWCEWVTQKRVFQEFVRNNMYGMMTVGRSLNSFVCYDRDYFIREIKPFLEVVIVREEAYGIQTGVLFRRKE
jgi:ubiquinone/menaquinone biosynthesis C-methylase UbiE